MGSLRLSILFLLLGLMEVIPANAERILYTGDTFVAPATLVTDEQSPEKVAARKKALDQYAEVQRGRAYLTSCCATGKIYRAPSGLLYGSPRSGFSPSRPADSTHTWRYSRDSGPFAPYHEPLYFNQPGNHRLTFQEVDSQGKISDQVIENLVIDPDPPEIIPVISGNHLRTGHTIFLGKDASIIFRIADLSSGADRFLKAENDQGYMAYDGKPLPSSDMETLVVQLFAADHTGNARTEVYKLVRDATGPEIIMGIRPPLNNSVCAPGSVAEFEAQDPAGVSTLEYRVNGSIWAPYNAKVVLPQTPVVKVEARAMDRLGNQSEPFSFECRVSAKENQAPAGVPQ